MRRTLVLLALMATFAAVAYAQTAGQERVDLEIYADQFDRLADGTATLSGSVVVLVNGIHIAADYGTFNANWKRFEFGGAVRITPTPNAKTRSVRMLIGPHHPRPVPALEVTPIDNRRFKSPITNRQPEIRNRR